MRETLVGLVLVLLSVQVACAGHGTIEETETSIVVEYTGDATDGAPILKGKDLSVNALVAAPTVVSAAGPVVEEGRGESISGVSGETRSSERRRPERTSRRRRTEASNNPE